MLKSTLAIGPTFSQMPKQASRFGSVVPHDHALVSLWDLASVTPGSARGYQFYLMETNPLLGPAYNRSFLVTFSSQHLQDRKTLHGHACKASSTTAQSDTHVGLEAACMRINAKVHKPGLTCQSMDSTGIEHLSLSHQVHCRYPVGSDIAVAL